MGVNYTLLQVDAESFVRNHLFFCSDIFSGQNIHSGKQVNAS